MTDKTISVPIYDFRVRVIISDTYESFEQDVFDAGYEEDVQDAGMIVFPSPQMTKTYVLCIHQGDISHGNVAHECLHIANRVWESVGGELDYRNDEPLCYLLGFLVDCVHKIISDDRKGR
jgi:hypothetical protein